MRKAWLWVLILGLALWSPVLGQEPESSGQEPPPEGEAAAAPAEEGAAGDAVAEEGAAGAAAAAAEEPGSELLLEAVPLEVLPPPVLFPTPAEIQVLDIPNDDGTGLGVLWKWNGAAGEALAVTIEIEVATEILKQFELSSDEIQSLEAARSELASALAPLLPERTANEERVSAAMEALAVAIDAKDPNIPELRKQLWVEKVSLEKLTNKIQKLKDRFASAAGQLDEKDQHYRYLQASLAASPWLATNAAGMPAGEISTKGDYPERFGHDPAEADKFYLEITQIRAMHPGVFDGSYDGSPDAYDNIPPRSVVIPVEKNLQQNLRMVLSEGEASSTADLGGATTKVNFFNFSVLNNLIFAVLFGMVILAAIVIARRNPNMFIRRINGLEAVDEAIGRATEMGKPVLYLTGLDPLSALSTLAAINILGRVARRIADYDSDLIVPCRDPVALTVAQEVVREAYTDQGRPDAYRQDNIYFVTDDQFSFTASVCAIMIREKPAANFLMGYYYAESLLLAETGATTGAIQIAGTDAIHQLPFFITTCDYTLIGEELYAASAYLSREPMLLGSLKGQDLGKALVMIMIVLQTLFFLFSDELDFIKTMVEPL